MRRIAWIAIAVGLVPMVALARQAEPAPQPQEQRPDLPRGEPPKPEDRAAFRARLERWLADNKRTQERLEAAIKKLDSGASVADAQTESRFGRPRGERNGQDKDRAGGGPPRMPGDELRRPEPPTGERLSRETVIEFIQKSNPEMAKRMQDLLRDNPSFGGRLVDRVEPMVREIISERDPEMRQLRIENMKNGFELLGATRAMVEANRQDPAGEDAKQKTAHLRQVLGTHFDLMVKMHQQEILMLERRIRQLREELDHKLGGREEFIDKRIEDAKRVRSRGGPGGPSGSPDKPAPK